MKFLVILFMQLKLFYTLQVEGLTEVILLGYYQLNENLAEFVEQMKKKFSIPVT